MYDFPLENRGQVGVVCGPMRSGKSDILIVTAERLDYSKGRLPYGVFKPASDTRDEGVIRSRTGRELSANAFEKPRELYEATRGKRVVFIDEAQFADAHVEDGDEGIVAVVNALAKDDKHILLFGLDLTSDNTSFGPMGNLLLHADYVQKIRSLCATCGNPARYSPTKNRQKKEQDISVGDEEYTVACRKCY